MFRPAFIPRPRTMISTDTAIVAKFTISHPP
jgi:hypothetical protein